MTRTDTPAPQSSGRGRHRKPRPRKVLLTTGGLALAAGALSLVRLIPGSGSGGIAATEARTDLGRATSTDHDGADRSSVAADAVPVVSPSATSPLGGPGTPTTARTPVSPATPSLLSETAPPPAPKPTSTSTSATASLPTAVNDRPEPAAPRHPPASGATAPPSRTTPTAPPSQPDRPAPGRPDEPGLCVPVIGVCVGSTDGDR